LVKFNNRKGKKKQTTEVEGKQRRADLQKRGKNNGQPGIIYMVFSSKVCKRFFPELTKGGGGPPYAHPKMVLRKGLPKTENLGEDVLRGYDTGGKRARLESNTDLS